MAKENRPQNLNLQITPDVSQGCYSNLAVITHNATEFVLDFAQLLPGVEGAQIRQRVIMNPLHAKKLLNALIDNVRKYEDYFGIITEPSVRDATEPVPYDVIGKA